MDDHHLATRRPGLTVLLLAVVAAALLFVCSCASGDDGPNSIPTAPAQARVLTGDEIPFDPEVMAENFRASLGASAAEIQVYSFPADSTFATIVAHYQSHLSGPWHEQSSAALDSARAEGREVMLWTSDETGEVLSLQFVGAPDRDANILIVIYAQRE